MNVEDYRQLHIKRFCQEYTQGKRKGMLDYRVFELFGYYTLQYDSRLYSKERLRELLESQCINKLNHLVDNYNKEHDLELDPFDYHSMMSMRKCLADRVLAHVDAANNDSRN